VQDRRIFNAAPTHKGMRTDNIDFALDDPKALIHMAEKYGYATLGRGLGISETECRAFIEKIKSVIDRALASADQAAKDLKIDPKTLKGKASDKDMRKVWHLISYKNQFQILFHEEVIRDFPFLTKLKPTKA